MENHSEHSSRSPLGRAGCYGKPPLAMHRTSSSFASARDPVGSFLGQARATAAIGIQEIEAVLRLIAVAGRPLDRFLDLTCTGGMLSIALLSEYSHALGTVIEHRAHLMECPCQGLASRLRRIDCQSGDFFGNEVAAVLASSGPYALILLSSNEATGSARNDHARYRDVFRALHPGGLLLDIAVVASATRWTQSPLDDRLIEMIFGEVMAAPPKMNRAEIARRFYELNLHRDAPDHAPLEVRCDWLREIGFENVECFLRVGDLAIFGGQRP